MPAIKCDCASVCDSDEFCLWIKSKVVTNFRIGHFDSFAIFNNFHFLQSPFVVKFCGLMLLFLEHIYIIRLYYRNVKGFLKKI
nr:MAG TPA: hypothetical protein [Caudoviricetes sp.]